MVQVRTAHGSVRADWVVPAVEGYSVTLPPLGRYQLPVQSLIVATEPLSAATWNEIGLNRGQAFSEFSRQVTYGQRTADNRLVFGARGGYRFGGRLRENFNLQEHEIELRRYLFEANQLSSHGGLMLIRANVPGPVFDMLEAFRKNSPAFKQLVAEHHFIDTYRAAWADAPYPPTFVTTDAVVVHSGHVLLVRRRAEPGKVELRQPLVQQAGHSQIQDRVSQELQPFVVVGREAAVGDSPLQ